MHTHALPLAVVLAAASAVPAIARQEVRWCTDVAGVRIPLAAGWTTQPAEGNVLIKAPGAGAIEFIVAGTGPTGELGDLESDAALAKIKAMASAVGGDAVPIGEPRRLAAKMGKGITFAFKGDQNGMELGLRIWLAVRGDKQFSLIAVAPPSRLATLASPIEALFVGAVPADVAPAPGGKPVPGAKPASGVLSANAGAEAKAWAARLSGAHVVLERTRFDNGSGTSTRIDFDFASAGTFVAKVRTTVSLNVGGAYAGSGFSDKTSTGTGRWRVIEEGGKVKLELDETGGKSRFTLEMKGGRVCLDGRPVVVSR